MSAARTAKPSMFERSKPGTSTSARTSSASTRPRARLDGDPARCLEPRRRRSTACQRRFGLVAIEHVQELLLSSTAALPARAAGRCRARRRRAARPPRCPRACPPSCRGTITQPRRAHRGRQDRGARGGQREPRRPVLDRRRARSRCDPPPRRSCAPAEAAPAGAATRDCARPPSARSGRARKELVGAQTAHRVSRKQEHEATSPMRPTPAGLEGRMDDAVVVRGSPSLGEEPRCVVLAVPPSSRPRPTLRPAPVVRHGRRR